MLHYICEVVMYCI